ncbi:type IV pilus assembly PilZ [Desulfovibrio sp. X2]|uniref:PilZ domain-containing protein n=1 Tax=Desulfovibrio sp. X2 TaxID=941449 RepID=UPI000358F519|nr:PilZ domain-containing protein [Desulfovibrio sp. X2]EPR42258.1 type IV pilus assembly PilZ [Desulfovibrio sp. X2]
MADEKRTFSRIETALKVYMRRVGPDAGFPVGFDCPGCEIKSDLDEVKHSGLPPALSDFLIELDRKLDILISLSSRKMIQEDYPLQGQVVEISGAGVLCRIAEPFRSDDHLEMILVLSSFPLALAGVVGRVVRKETEDAAGIPVWAVEFVKVRDADLEQIVQFVFKEQRARIREQKWS